MDDVSKKILASYLPYLNERFKSLDSYGVNHGFVRGRNPVSNALAHTGYKYTLSMDLDDFFSNVKLNHLAGLVHDDILRDCLIFGSPQQGLPTSPVLANIALASFDNRIVRLFSSMRIHCVYTRYADDLSFSFDDNKLYPKIKYLVEQAIHTSGFYVNKKKTRLQSLNNGRIIITGVGIDAHGIYPTRKTLKKLRAAIHQGNVRSTRGLHEWSRCKIPKDMVL